MIKAIIFDCWNTLFINPGNPHPFSRFAKKIGKSMDDYAYVKMFEKRFMLEKSLQLKISIKEFIQEMHIAYSPNLADELQQILHDAFMPPQAFPETIEVVDRLRKQYLLALITNTFPQSFNELEKKYGIFRRFKVILTSYETKLLKPDPRLFAMTIDQLGVKKEEAIMVGDSLKDDVEAAEQYGIKAVLVDRKGKHLLYQQRITSLEGLYAFLG